MSSLFYLSRSLLAGLSVTLLLAAPGRAQAEAQLLIEAATGTVLHAENATYPWYPASVTKLMTAYTTLRAIKDKKITFNTLLTVSKNAAAPSSQNLARIWSPSSFARSSQARSKVSW